MVQLQLLTGTRPQEVIALKPSEVLDRGDGTWLYTPAAHKTEHLGREKVIVIGSRAQEVLRPWLDRDPQAYCFSPAEAVAWSRRRRRKGPAAADATGPIDAPHLNPRYTRHSYRLAVQRACRRAGVPVWSPRQLRHTRATQIRAAFGSIEARRCSGTPTPG